MRTRIIATRERFNEKNDTLAVNINKECDGYGRDEIVMVEHEIDTINQNGRVVCFETNRYYSIR